jgi:hypothetical protein
MTCRGSVNLLLSTCNQSHFPHRVTKQAMTARLGQRVWMNETNILLVERPYQIQFLFPVYDLLLRCCKLASVEVLQCSLLKYKGMYICKHCSNRSPCYKAPFKRGHPSLKLPRLDNYYNFIFTTPPPSMSTLLLHLATFFSPENGSL